MSFRIRTHVASMVAQRHLNTSSESLGKVMEKMSSGLRVNRAADDAAGMAMGERLRADLRSLAQARRNTQDGVALLQVAEGSLAEVGNLLIRLRELAVQSASDTIGTRERAYLDLEFKQLKDEIDRIALTTEFNGSRLLTDSVKLPEPLESLQQGPLFELHVDKEFYPSLDGPDIKNPVNIIRLDLGQLNVMTSGEKSLNLGRSDDPDGTEILSKQGAQSAIHRLDKAMESILAYRADIGSLQNRLEVASENLGVRMEGLSASRSRIVDGDFADLTAEFSKQQILQQAGAAVLTQANQMHQVALKLLQ